MKKLIYLLLVAIAISVYGCRKTGDYVLVGQLAYTGRHNFPEKLNGKVQEIRWNAFWAKEENGKVVRGDIYINPGIIQKYNSSGTILSFVPLDAEGKTRQGWWSVEVEAEGKIINKALYYLNDTLRGYTKNTYTGNNLTEVKFFDSENDTLMGSVVYNYDQNGNRIKWQAFTPKNEPRNYVEFSYSSEGFNEQMKQYSAQGEMTHLYDYILNDKGNKISEHHEDFVNDTIIDAEIKYEYDNKGNWIKRVFYQDNKPIYLSEREIKYYE